MTRCRASLEGGEHVRIFYERRGKVEGLCSGIFYRQGRAVPLCCECLYRKRFDGFFCGEVRRQATARLPNDLRRVSKIGFARQPESTRRAHKLDLR